MNVKKVWFIFLGIIVIVVGASYTVLTLDFNRFNKERYYIQITQNGEKLEDRLDNGETMVRYGYKVDAIKEDGKHKELEFSANKQLRKGAYLMLYVNKEGEVSSYDEVSKKDMLKDAS